MLNRKSKSVLLELAKALVWLLCLPFIAFLAVLNDTIKMGRK